MLKKIFALNVLVVIIVNTICEASAVAEKYDIYDIVSINGDESDYVVENGIVYNLSGNQADIIDFNSSDSEITIPEKIEYNQKVYSVKYMWLERDYFKGFTTMKSKNTCEKLILSKSLEFTDYFINWKKLKELYIPENSNIESVGPIYNCPNIKKLYISKNIRYVPDIKNCPKLKLSISKENEWFKLINNNIYSKNGKILYKIVTDKTKLVVAKKVTKIYENAFLECKKLKSVNMNGVKEIGGSAFYKCKNLSKVKIGNKKKAPKIEKRAFKSTKKGIKFYVKNKKVAKSLKKQLKGSGVRNAKILIGKKVVYKNVK